MPQAVLSANLKALMGSSKDLNTQRKLGVKAGIDQRTVGRILNEEHSPNLQQIAKLALAFDMLPWQLLVPGLDPADPPVTQLSRTERDLYARTRAALATLPPLPDKPTTKP